MSHYLRRICLAAMILISTAELFSLSLLLNGELWKEWHSAEMDRIYYKIPPEYQILPEAPAFPSPQTGILLWDLIPPLYELEEIRLNSREGLISLTGPDLQEAVERALLIPAEPGGWNLIWPDGRLFQGLELIHISGESLVSAELEVWIAWEGTKALKKEIALYADRHGLDIEVVNLPHGAAKFLSVLRGGGKLPDLIMLSAGDLNRLVQTGALQTFPPSLTENLNEQGNRAFRSGGRQWALPFYYDTQLIFYNPGLIDLAAFPELTLGQLEASAAALSARVPVPLSWNAYSLTWFSPFQYAFGKDSPLAQNGSVHMNDPATKDALEYLVNLNRKDWFRTLEKDAMLSLFASGKAAMIFSASYSIPYFQELGIPFGVVPFPVNEKTGRPLVPQLDFKAFAIAKRSRNPLLARHLLAHLTGPGVQQRFPVALSKLPVNEPVARMVRDWNPYYEILLKSAEFGSPVPSAKAYSVYKNIMWKLLRFALTGQMSPEAVLNKGQQLLNEELKQAALP